MRGVAPRPRIESVHTRRWGVVAASLALGLVLLAAFHAPAPAEGAQAADSQLNLTRFDHDITILPGRVASVFPFCRGGFALVSTSFNLISTNPSGPGNEPVVVLRSLVPQPKGATYTFENIGTITVTMRTSAHCARITVPPAFSPGARGPGAARPAAKRRPDPSLVSQIVTARKRVATAGSKVVTVRVRCTPRNSIPGDLGFESERAEFVGIRFFKQGGDIGAKLRFRVEGEDRITAHLVCVQGKGVQMKGDIARGAGRASERRAGSAASARRKPGIVVRYFSSSWVGNPDIPFPGVTTFTDTEPRTFWMNGVPSDVPEGSHWMSRGFLGPTGLPSAASLRAPFGSPAGPPAGAADGEQIGFIEQTKLPVLGRLFKARAAELVRVVGGLGIVDERDPDRLPNLHSPACIFRAIGETPPETTGQTIPGGQHFEIDCRALAQLVEKIRVRLAESEPSDKRIIAREVTERLERSGASAFTAGQRLTARAVDIEDSPDGRGFSFSPASNEVEVKVGTNQPNPTQLVVTAEHDGEVEMAVLDFGEPEPEGPRCSNGADDDSDGLEDENDPGCLSSFVGPDEPLAYNPNDESENHFAIPLDCAQLGGNVNTVIHAGVTLEAHMLVDGATGKALLRRTSADGDFLQGGPVAIGVCNNTTVSWEINNKSVRYTISVGAGGNGNATVLNVADTSGD